MDGTVRAARERMILPVLINDVPTDGGATLTWKFFSEDGKGDPQRVWQEKDEVIVCKGLPRGYIRTDQEFTDFALRLEWRWPKDKKPGRGGVLIRMTGEDKIWPKSLEAQINSPDAGDFWGLIGYNLAGPADRYKQLDHEQFGKLTNLKKIKAAEKATWRVEHLRNPGRRIRGHAQDQRPGGQPGNRMRRRAGKDLPHLRRRRDSLPQHPSDPKRQTD